MTKNVLVAENIIEDSYNGVVSVYPDYSGSGFAAQNIRIERNIFLNLNNTVPSSIAMICIGDSTDPSTIEELNGISISGNMVYNIDGNATFVNVYYGKNIDITENQIFSINQSKINLIIFVINANGETIGTNTYTDNVRIKYTKIISSNSIIMVRFNNVSISSAKVIVENNDVTSPNLTNLFNQSVAITNPNIYVIGHPLNGLSFSANVKPNRLELSGVKLTSNAW